MLTARQLHAQQEFVKWMFLLVAAGALALVLASQANGATTSDRPSPPGLLPAGIDMTARPMTAPVRAEEPADVRIDLWFGMELVRRADLDEARRVWTQMNLPAEAEPWRALAIGVVELK